MRIILTYQLTKDQQPQGDTNKMRVKIILNPSADNGRSRQHADALRACCQTYPGLELATTAHAGHATELARAAAADGYDVVAAAGGDGTVHEVVNGLVTGNQARVRLGVIPIGSGNDLAFALGIETDVETAVQRILHGQPKAIDLARVEDEYGRSRIFDNNAGVGFDAAVVIRTQQMTGVHGFLMYLMATLHTIAFYYNKPQMEIRFDQEQVAQRVLFLAIGVGHRGGGGFLLTPDARHDDDLLDSCLVNPIGRATMLSMLLRAMKGTHVTSRHVTMRQNKQIAIHAAAPLPIHVDGEMFAYPQDNVRRVTFTSLPAAIEVMV